MKKIVVLISGNGSNLQSIIDACQQNRINGHIAAVFSNNADAYGLQRAEQAEIPAHHINPQAYTDRTSYDLALLHAIDQYQPDLVVLAGYMRILSSGFVQYYQGRLLNIHPSLLPKYPGLHTHQKAIENGDKEHGISIHFVTEELDGGPIILQAKVPIFEDDREEDVIKRVQIQEHNFYPLVISWFLDERLAMKGSTAVMDGHVLPSQGYASE
ncbi:phosphoribosylglycinamide formyltransferase [Xenorhabdus nematophila]|uniref:phosphoribosylglycinamide formyltransferase n=1 Tax=Xenorhabdus nematophila TaxID=628 RepID=UPI000541D7A8|nr:phosphoribosylglycinamide formyltransferase [Xenorhabdus nematophila]CEF29303.1 phosphoribosylglycinamide formyltransferase 1 [Xenorhabdus nematophila str. Websteri]AYA39980.1 phosphoribosylglycinamide formyltransferase [Xenorhabdus nematophila]KHD28214.1 phosphoribosylglycinamide formyltransferase [Xenorhabdus nematophila]MBA0018618.1 phosphoribosylglycinamide formyltransferase [Xenorhabdus nematophila]MCB4425747.1 phosphoribosylglycinamide formyltransferase [Xenorhabdus nematophila]